MTATLLKDAWLYKDGRPRYGRLPLITVLIRPLWSSQGYPGVIVGAVDHFLIGVVDHTQGRIVLHHGAFCNKKLQFGYFHFVVKNVQIHELLAKFNHFELAIPLIQ